MTAEELAKIINCFGIGVSNFKIVVAEKSVRDYIREIEDVQVSARDRTVTIVVSS